MTTYVVDASVAIKWLVPEAGTDAALALRGHRLLAPDLLMSECANILWKKVRRQELLPAEALMAVRLLIRSDIDLESTRSLTEAATRLALSLDHPAYDCVYIALAQANFCQFVTADERLCDKVRMHGLGETVLSLTTLSPDPPR